jgi:hypothetical protein
MRDKPWLQGFGLIDRSLTYPALRMAEVKDDGVTINGHKQVILNNVKTEKTAEAPVIEKTVKVKKVESKTTEYPAPSIINGHVQSINSTVN